MSTCGDDTEILEKLQQYCLECNHEFCKRENSQHFQISFLQSQNNRISEYIQYSNDLKNKFKDITSTTCHKCQRYYQGSYFIVQYAIGVVITLCNKCCQDAKRFQLILRTPVCQVSLVNAVSKYWCIQCKKAFVNEFDLFEHSSDHSISLTKHEKFQDVHELYYNYKNQDSSEQFKVYKICKNDIKQKCNQDSPTYVLKLKEKNTLTMKYYCEQCFYKLKLEQHTNYDILLLIRDRSLKYE